MPALTSVHPRWPVLLATLALAFAAHAARAQVAIEPAFLHLRFDYPVGIEHAGDGSDRLFVVEKSGAIRVFDNNPETPSAEIFLDLRERVDDSHLEKGLLGLAFHPEYETNRFFYVNYTADEPDRTVIARFEVDPSDPDHALSESETVILEIEQPYDTHNGGRLVFGPDGYLYVGMGDGGWAGDPEENAQDTSTLLGAVLRIDVDHPTEDRTYGIPSDNPFVGADCAPDDCLEEIWAYGFRNPWRFSFDPETGWMWLGDVGQEGWEEIDVVEKGGNYGWDVVEGTHCYEPASGCDTTGLTPPVWEFAHTPGNSVTGGMVYRGSEAPELAGQYVFGNWGTGNIWTIPADDPTSGATEVLDTHLRISTFGLDEQGEIYLAHFRAGSGLIYRIISEGGSSTENIETPAPAARMAPVRPNPFRDRAILRYTLERAAQVHIEIYDVRGRRIRALPAAQRPAGMYEVSWDGTAGSGETVAPGVYVARLLVDGEPAVSRPMVRLAD